MAGEITEETVRMVLDLPEGKDWVFRGDLNILVLSSRLTPEEREVAITECQSEWRRSFLRVVTGDKGRGVCPEVA